MQMAKALMESFPYVQEVTFGTSNEEMAEMRKDMALHILNASG